MFSLDISILISCAREESLINFQSFPSSDREEVKFWATKQLASREQRDSCEGKRAIMPKKRSSQSGSNSATAKLISRINKFGQNSINNSDSEQANESYQRNHFGYDDDDDEVFVLSAKQKQQLQRNEYLESLTKEQLKIEAKRRGQKTAGTKTELVDSPTLLHLAVFLCALICEIGTSTFFRLLFFSICRSTFCCNSHRFLCNFFFHLNDVGSITTIECESPFTYRFQVNSCFSRTHFCAAQHVCLLSTRLIFARDDKGNVRDRLIYNSGSLSSWRICAPR